MARKAAQDMPARKIRCKDKQIRRSEDQEERGIKKRSSGNMQRWQSEDMGQGARARQREERRGTGQDRAGQDRRAERQDRTGQD
eukprot:748926-Hanusia_phi.AAC.2